MINGVTYMDELCTYLSHKIDDTVMAVFEEFAAAEEYDSEAITDDVISELANNYSDSNMFAMTNAKNMIELITEFFKRRQSM